MESPKCHLLALKLRGSLCFFYTCSSQKTTDRASRIQGPIQCGCTIKRKNTHTHTRKYKTNAHELRQGYTVETLTHTHTHTWRGYKCMAVSLCFCTVTTLCGFKHFKCHLPPLWCSSVSPLTASFNKNNIYLSHIYIPNINIESFCSCGITLDSVLNVSQLVYGSLRESPNQIKSDTFFRKYS